MSRNLYILRIKLRWAKGVWREIAIRGDQTLHELNKALLDAFEWTDEDAYRFTLSDDPADLSAIYAPGSPQDSEQTRMDDLRLDEEQEFFYVFSEGERNLFTLRVMSIDEPEEGIIYPDVVDERGESPEQELAYR